MNLTQSCPIADLQLLMPDKADPERDLVGDAWMRSGGTVLRIGRFWDPPALGPQAVRIYGPDTFALVLAQKLNIRLLSPPDDLLANLPFSMLRRNVTICTLGESSERPYPAFIKPLIPKLFPARIYPDHDVLMNECTGLEPDTQILVSDIVPFIAEARAFILDGYVLDFACYEGDQPVHDARRLVEAVAQLSILPRSCVLDVGFIHDQGWAVIEANAAWGAGLNGCSAEKIIPSIAAATK